MEGDREDWSGSLQIEVSEVFVPELQVKSNLEPS